MDASESLFDCLEEVADPRRARGIRHPFQAILRLTLQALRQAQGAASLHGPRRHVSQVALAGTAEAPRNS